MEDGNCRQSQKDSIIPLSNSYDTQLPGRRYDNNYVNGNSDGLHKFQKRLLPNQDNIFPKGDKLKFTDHIHDTKPKNTHKSENNSFLEAKNSIGSFRKTQAKQTSKVNNFKSGLHKYNSDNCFEPNENGNRRYEGVPPEKFLSDPNFLNNRKLALRHLHRQRALKKKRSQKIGKQNASYQTEYAQYLGLQPTVKFKCSKCCCTSFESLGMLKEHQRSCSSQVSLQSAAEAEPSAGNKTNFRITRKVYLCSACGTYYENWNLFLHIREVHNRHICLFCLGMFSQAHKLASHLVVKHNVKECEFTSKEEFFSKYSDSFYLMCCKCENVFTERENFILHECTQAIKQCSSCKLRGSHKSDCPKNSKHKLNTVQSQIDNKKIKKNLPEKKSFDRQTLPNEISAKAPSSDNGHSSVAVAETEREHLSSMVDDTVELEECKPVKAADSQVDETPKDSCDLTSSSQVFDNNIHSRETEDVPKEPPVTLPVHEHSIVTSVSADSVSENHIEMDSQISIPPEPASQSFPDFGTAVQDDKSSADNIGKMTSRPRPNFDSLKTVLKPPARNRRPPKRYQLKDNRVTADLDMSNSEGPPEVKDTAVEVVNRVPKLTVKVPKMFIDKESTSDYSSESEDSEKLTVDFDTTAVETENDISPIDNKVGADCESVINSNKLIPPNDISKTDPEVPAAGEDVPLTELTLDRPLDPYPLRNLLKLFLSATMYHCIYCNHARKIAVNGKQLGLHFIAQHRFSATVDSITAEELLPETIVQKIKSCLQDVQSAFLNMNGYDSVEKVDLKYYDHTYECFQCYFITTVHKELYLHNRKMHQKTILLCIMCKSNFYSYSELLCHLCPGTYVLDNEIQFRCCLCELDSIPSAFRLMVHLRKRHHACDVCLETCHSQSKLSNHVWKHKLHHLCYRCGIAYRNKPDITKHLYWKHGTQSVLCKKCLQKKWPHVYHFCVPPVSFSCEECNLNFTKAVCLRVHKRSHAGEKPHLCQEENCSEGFISKKLLAKHALVHSEQPVPPEPVVSLSSVAEDVTEKVTALLPDSENQPAVTVQLDVKTPGVKLKKSKKSKKNADKDNLLIDVNLPELNLSESDSSDGSDTEVIKSKAEVVDIDLTLPDGPTDLMPDDIKPEPPVAGIWDNFKMYQAKIEKNEEKMMENLVPRHVCESDHDYCAIPPSEVSEVKDFNDTKVKVQPSEGKNISNKERKKAKWKKKNLKKEEGGSSSTDSSSQSDSSCSCGTDCSCSSDSGSSSSGSSSSGSVLSGQALRNVARKDSDASRASAVDIMATEEFPPTLVPEVPEAPVAESDLDTEETETDEDFYDAHPQRSANKIIAEKRNRLLLLASAEQPDTGCPSEPGESDKPEKPEKRVKKKVKTKKKKKEKRGEPHCESVPKINFINSKANIPDDESNMKITISLQTNTVQVFESGPINLSAESSSRAASDAESKRASKRRRVPNRFYGYSSDEDKSHLPPKLEWRKEDLPSPASPPRIPRPPDIAPHPPQPVRFPEPPRPPPAPSSDDSDSSREGALQINFPPFQATKRDDRLKGQFPVGRGLPFPRRAGAREAREGESVYCYCRCPYDEVSEMIACDADGCAIEWFHFECVDIEVPPQGKWYCPDCSSRLGIVPV